MADKIDRVVSSVADERPMHQMENRTMNRTSNYNETVRANNRRADSGQAMKKLPRGKIASQRWTKGSGR